MAVVLKIAGWGDHFENNRTRELKKMDWVPVPTKQDGDGYTELVSHKNGAAHLGAWMAIVQVAAKCEVRGTLVRDGLKPHDSTSLARISRLPRGVFDEAIPRLLAIGWLESEVVTDSALREIPQEGAGEVRPAPQEGAGEVRPAPQEGATSRVRPRAPATQQESTEQDSTGEEKTASCSEPPAATAEPPIMVFTTVGKSKSWGLLPTHVSELSEAFPKLDIVGECRKARQWCISNEIKRKTPGGMPKFLFAWMTKAQERGGSGYAANSDPRHVQSSLNVFLGRGENGES